jgi:hypothetical protein
LASFGSAAVAELPGPASPLAGRSTTPSARSALPGPSLPEPDGLPGVPSQISLKGRAATRVRELARARFVRGSAGDRWRTSPCSAGLIRLIHADSAADGGRWRTPRLIYTREVARSIPAACCCQPDSMGPRVTASSWPAGEQIPVEPIEVGDREGRESVRLLVVIELCRAL